MSGKRQMAGLARGVSFSLCVAMAAWCVPTPAPCGEGRVRMETRVVSYAPTQGQYPAVDAPSHEGPYEVSPRYEVNGRMTSGVGWRLDPITKRKWEYHRGWDIAMPDGSPVRPSLPGKVLYSGWYGGYGWLIAVDHGNGYVTLYGHNRRNLAVTGSDVDTGTIIALSGSSGRTTGPHLHYEIRKW